MLNQNEFIEDIFNLVIQVRTNKTTEGTRVNELIDAFYGDAVEYGDSKGYISVDTLSASDYSKTSSLLQVNEPTMDEQFLTTTDRKKVAVTINRYLMKGAFANEGSLSECLAVIESMLEKTKIIYTYKKIIAAFEGYVPAKQTQKLEVNLIDTTGMTGVTLTETKKANAITLYEAIRGLSLAMQTPSRAYNDLGFEEMYSPDDLVFLKNSKIESRMNAYAYANLLNSDKLDDIKLYDKSIIIPESQLTPTPANKDLVGWLCSKGKYQVLPRFTIATAFQDGSNLMTNEWLHFWYISGFVNGLACVKIVANYITPAE